VLFVLSAELGGCVESCRLGIDGCGGPWRACARRLRRSSYMRPISSSVTGDRYSKRVAETENKAKKKLVSITTETSM
jgi:hypothetical protein